jgi:hypothetical protein
MSKQTIKSKLPPPPMRVLPPRDASILALLVQHPDAPRSKRELLVNSLTKEGRSVAAALGPDNRRENSSGNALTTADGLKYWFKENMASLRSKLPQTRDSSRSKSKGAARRAGGVMAARSTKGRGMNAAKKK